MKLTLIIALLFLFTAAGSHSAYLKKGSNENTKLTYKIFDKDGKEIDYDSMLEKLKTSEFVLLGEHHNDAMIHWLHYEIVKDLYTARDSNLTIGVEFFERDDQLVLDEYFAGHYAEKKFLKEAHFWKNYPTDYRPVLEFAKKNKIRYIATNIPRRYASVVNHKGLSYLDSLSESAKEMIAPLPFPTDTSLSTYNAMFDMMKSHDGTWDMVYAQMSKDATMAWFIVQNHHPEKLFIHIQGSGHSDEFQGIAWYLKQYRPESKIKTVSISPQESLEELDEEKIGVADFIIAVPENFTKTFREPQSR